MSKRFTSDGLRFAAEPAYNDTFTRLTRLAMESVQGYVLGSDPKAGRRLAVQDAHFAEVSELLLDELAVRSLDRVVELGCGSGSLSKRIYRRLGIGGTLVSVDRSEGLLKQATALLEGTGPAVFVPTLADLTELGPWIDGAGVVVGRAVLHHVPMAELFVGRLRTRLAPGTRVGFIEPDFRSVLGRIAVLEAEGRHDLEPLRVWAWVINTLYQVNRISPDVGATLARTMETAGFQKVKADWRECRSDDLMTENLVMFYDEVRERLGALGLMTSEEITRQQKLMQALGRNAPAAWASFRVTAIA